MSRQQAELNLSDRPYSDLQDYGIEIWLDEGSRLMLSDPSPPPLLSEQDNVQSFELPLSNQTGVFAVLVFERRIAVKGRRIFQATAVRQTRSQRKTS